MEHIGRHPGWYGLLLLIVLLVIMDLTSDVVIIEVINGKEYIVAINGKELEIPRTPTPLDLDKYWIYRETNESIGSE